MFFSRLFSRCKTSTRSKPLSRSYKPAFCVLEDRIVPSGFHSYTPPVPGPATHLEVEILGKVKSGQAFTVEVEALDANNHHATGYLGTVMLSLATADGGSTVPGNYPFTAADSGTHFFTVTLTVLGSQTITATDTVTATITGSASTTVLAAPIVTSFYVDVPQHIASGSPVTVTVVALDQYHQVVTGYVRKVHFTSSDGTAVLPADYTFLSTDLGRHNFLATFNTQGAETITATDTVTPSITGTDSTTVQAPAILTSFVIQSPKYALSGGPVTITVVAIDQYHHVMTNYTGPVHLASTPGIAAVGLPVDYTFLATDLGKHAFTVTFNTVGTENLAATAGSITGLAMVNVEAATAVTHFRVFTDDSAPLGIATSAVVVALDANNHVVAGYTGAVHLSSTDPLAVGLPVDYTFQASDNGRHVFSIIFNTLGSQTLTATDIAALITAGTDNVMVSSHQHYGH